MRVKRTKAVDGIVKDLQEHVRYLRSVGKSIAKKPPRGRVKQSVEMRLAQSLELHKEAKALASSRRKLATREARIAKRIREMKRKPWGKVKKRRKTRRK